LAAAADAPYLKLALASWMHAVAQARSPLPEEAQCERCRGWAEVAEDTQRRATELVAEAHELSCRAQRRAAEAEGRSQDLQRRLQEAEGRSQDLQRRLEEALAALERDAGAARRPRGGVPAQREAWARRLASVAARPCLQLALLAWSLAARHAPPPPHAGHRETIGDAGPSAALALEAAKANSTAAGPLPRRWPEPSEAAAKVQERQLAAVGDRLWKHAVLAAWRQAASARAVGGAPDRLRAASCTYSLLIVLAWRLVVCAKLGLEVKALCHAQAAGRSSQLLRSALAGWRRCARCSGLLRWRSWAHGLALLRTVVCAWRLAVFELRVGPGAGCAAPRSAGSATPPYARATASATARMRSRPHTGAHCGGGGSVSRKPSTPSRVPGCSAAQAFEVPCRSSSSSAAPVGPRRQGLSEGGRAPSTERLDRGDFKSLFLEHLRGYQSVGRPDREDPRPWTPRQQQEQPFVHTRVTLVDLTAAATGTPTAAGSPKARAADGG